MNSHVSFNLILKWKLIAFILVMVNLVRAEGLDTVAGNEPSPIVGQGATELIEDLGHASYQIREKASRELWQAGRESLPALELASASVIPEVRYRAIKVRSNILLGITPDTDPKVLAIIDEIRTAESEEELGQWCAKLEGNSIILVRLYVLEKNLKVKQWLLKYAKPVALAEASHLLSEKKLKEAEELLNHFPKLGNVANGLVAIYHYEGRVKEEIEKLKTLKKQDSEMMRRLLIQNQDWEELRKWALRKKDEGLLAQLDVMAGSPRALAKLVSNYYYKSSKLGPGTYQVDGYKLLEAVENEEFEEADKWADRLYDRGATGTNRVKLIDISTPLLLNGRIAFLEDGLNRFYLGLGEQMFRNSVGSFIHSLEKPQMLMELVGAPKSKTKLLQWVRRSIRRAENAEPLKPFQGRGLVELRRLYTVVEVYNSRGDKAMVRQMLAPLFKRLLEVDASLLEVAMIESCYRDLGWFVVEQLAQLKLGAVGGFYEKYFDEFSEPVIEIWRELEKKGEVKAFIKMAMLTGLIRESDTVDLEKLHDELVAGAEKLQGHDRVQRFNALLELARERGDGFQAKALVERLIPLTTRHEKDEILATRFDFLVGMQDWAEVEIACRKKEQLEGAEFVNYMIWAVALKKLGREQEFQEKLKFAELLQMNDLKQRLSTIYTLLRYGLGDVAYRMIDEMLVSLKFDTGAYRQLVQNLNTYYAYYIKRKDWRRAYGLAVANKYVIMLDCNDRLSGGFGYAPGTLLTVAGYADLSKGMLLLEDRPKMAERYLRKCADYCLNGHLADHYFPALKQAGLMDLHKEAYEKLTRQYLATVKEYPNSHNTLNSVAWLSAMCSYKLDRAEKLVKRALAIAPNTPAYTDTFAEIYFRRGNREKAIEISKKAVEQTVSGRSILSSRLGYEFNFRSSLLLQLEHFEKDPLPVPKAKEE